jgi:hypothetical protein
MASDRHAAFIPWATMYMGFSPNTQEERHLKMATMAFDDVYLPVGADHLSNIRAQMADDLNVQLKPMEGAWHSVESIHPNLAGKQLATECFTPPQSMVYDSSGAWKEELRGAIDAELAAYFGVSSDEIGKLKGPKSYEYMKEGNALANSGVGSILVWTMLRSHLECAYFAFNEVEFAAADLLLCRDERSSFRAANLLMPDAGELSWEEVFDIRERPEALSFRQWLHSRNWANSDNKSIEQDVIGALLDVVDDCRPNVGTEILKGVASNIPLPIPINPAGLAMSVKSIFDARRFRRKYDWAFFLRERRKRLNPNGQD